jgi:hypothetical protein
MTRRAGTDGEPGQQQMDEGARLPAERRLAAAPPAARTLVA